MGYNAIFLQSVSAVINAAKPETCLPPHIPPPPKGRMIVIGAGKASAEMARVFENHYDGALEGIVVTRYGFGAPTQRIRIMEAAHPVSDTAGITAVDAISTLLETATADDCVVCLLSGGGSALLTAPVDGVSFEDVQAVGKDLLLSGADITAINTIRKHLNRALGGGLAKLCPNVPIVTLAISDVAGNDPSTIASGPTMGDHTTLDDCRRILKQYDITIPNSIAQALQNPKNETPLPDDPLITKNTYTLITTPEVALEHAATFWKAQGYTPHILDTTLEGDTNMRAREHATLARDIAAGTHDIKPPCALITGGETTVKVTGHGRGGPNTQFMLQAAITLDGIANVHALAADTDGIDGNGDNAGAVITPQTLAQAAQKDLNPQDYLDNNDAYHFFEALGHCIKTGPTHTNVNDYRVFLIT